MASNSQLESIAEQLPSLHEGIEERQKEVASLQNEMEYLKNDIKVEKMKNREMKERYESTFTQQENIEELNKSLQSEIMEYSLEISSLLKQLADKQGEIAELKRGHSEQSFQ